MTNPTPTENERIALFRGWRKLRNGMWKDSDGSLWMGIPDFLHKWEHAGPLLEELIKGAGLHFAWYLVTEVLQRDKCTLIEAISRAWLAWKEEEKSEPSTD